MEYIQIVVASVKYDRTSEIINNELPIISLKEVLPEDYPKYIKVGAWEDGGELLFQPYLRAKIEERYHNVDIAIKIPENISKTVERITTEPSGYAYQRYKSDGYVYYLPPRCFEQNPFNRKKEEKITGHYNTIGSETIQIQYKDRIECMTLLSMIQKEEYDFYQSLVFDLVSIEQQLCIDDKSAMSMAVKWSDYLYEKTERMVMDFYDAFCGLEKQAQPELKYLKEKMLFHKVKKMTSQALIEHEIFHKDKVRSVSYQENFDTFEHRVIKTHLFRLKDIVEVRQKMERLALENERNRCVSEMRLSEEELKNQIDGLNIKIEKRKQELREKCNKTYDVPELESVYIQFRVRDLLQADEIEQGILDFRISGIDRPMMRVKSRTSDGRQVIDARGCRYKSRKRGQQWSEWKPYKTQIASDGYGEQREALVTNFIHISVPIDCKISSAMLFHYLYSDEAIIGGNDVVGIWGKVKENGYSSVNEKGYSVFQFEFYEILGITLFDSINGRIGEKERETYTTKNLTEEQKQEYVDELEEYILNLDVQGDDENLGFYTEELENYRLLTQLNADLDDENQLNEKWEKLFEYLEQIEYSSLMREVQDIRTEINTSNLFMFHPQYQKMYDAIMQSEKVLDGVEYRSFNQSDEFQIAKLPQLYEVWCCVKLVLIFIQNYGFEFDGIADTKEQGVEGLKQYIKNILLEKELNGTQFKLHYLENRTRMDVTIWYDREIKIDSERLSNQNMFAKNKRSHLRPDIIMEICVSEPYIAGVTQKIFVLDAKYRKDGYNGIQDLCEVAFQKYMLELGTGANFIQEFGHQVEGGISGSFILHNTSFTIPSFEEDENVEKVYNPKLYLGAYPDAFVNTWLENSKKYHWNVSEDRFREWTTWNLSNDNHENQIGVLTVNPKENKLPYFIQMIMEQHFKRYRSRCWICGSKEIDIECKKTEKGYPKYYIKCRNPECNKFMVETHCGQPTCPSHNRRLKIGKHRINYYAKVKSKNSYACWNVSCPKCRQLASKENSDLYCSDIPVPF